jgi:tetratricopeptide (TPR) repeat protein
MNDEEERRVPISEAMRQAAELHESGDLANAEAYYQAILESQPDHPGANYNLALIKLQTDRASEALPILKEALDQDPKQGTHWLNYAVALVGTDRAADARKLLLEARRRGLRDKALDEALQKVEAKLSADQQAAKARWLDTGDREELLSLYRERRLEEAQALAGRLTEQSPRAGLPWGVLGAICMDKSHYEAAVPFLEKARDLVPQSVLVLRLLGVAYRRVERNEDARVVFEEGLAIAPDSFDILVHASANALSFDDVTAARSYADRAIALRPDAPEAVRVLADAANAAGNVDEAAQLYARLAGMDGQLAGA